MNEELSSLIVELVASAARSLAIAEYTARNNPDDPLLPDLQGVASYLRRRAERFLYENQNEINAAQLMTQVFKKIEAGPEA